VSYVNLHDEQYLLQLERIVTEGIDRKDRTGVGTRGLFGMQGRYDLREGFPLLTTKKIFTKGVFEELLWFLRGETNVRSLQEKGVHIWDEWADENGDLGPVYGSQWRSWDVVESDHLGQIHARSIDQITKVIDDIKNNPFSRRHIVTAWNPAEIEGMALPPCHTMFQFYVTPDENGEPEFLSCQLYQRSGDMFIGVPFNIASYALLTEMVADQVGLEAGEFVHTLGDAHIYLNHMEQVTEQLSRPNKAEPPTLLLQHRDSIFDYTIDDIVIHDYHPQASIKAPIAV
jgi:thymidylate synthase